MNEQVPSKEQMLEQLTESELSELRAFKQAVMDPENQPSQFGTVLMSGVALAPDGSLPSLQPPPGSTRPASEPPAAPVDRKRLRDLIGSFDMEPAEQSSDNLAVALCTYFERNQSRPKGDPETDNGWGQWTEQQVNRVLDGLTDLAINRASQPPTHAPVRVQVAHPIRGYDGSLDCEISAEVASRISVDNRHTEPPEDVIRTRAFWSPDSRYLVTAYISANDISLMDDNGDIWRGAGDEQVHGPSETKEAPNAVGDFLRRLDDDEECLADMRAAETKEVR